MSREPIVLITGANGEVGHGLISYFSAQPHVPDIITLDLKPLDEKLMPLVKQHIVGDIRDRALLQSLGERYAISTIFHLAALLSTSGERQPKLAHEVNVNGTQQLLDLAVQESQAQGKAVKFIFPSSIAVYGLPSLADKQAADALSEDEHLMPITMYGVNKLYCENLGRYYTRHYQQLTDERPVSIDFRSVRFPGLISAHTVPSGGTSDYGPEMIHSAAQGQPYACFVRPDSTLPFMVMPDGIRALIQLAEAPREALSRQVYNVTSFSLSAADFAEIVLRTFPNAEIHFQPSAGRQRIVDSWAGVIDDSIARADWAWSPEYDIDSAFNEYLFPHICKRYQQTERCEGQGASFVPKDGYTTNRYKSL
ncbi:MAG: NAD-dependent epimerase/dehydratase family protein [Anaerolineae bacterium]